MTCPVDSLRIGGDFEIRADFFSRAADHPAPCLPTAHTAWTDTGRSALLLVARDILRRGGAPVVWLPAYCCGSVTQAFAQANFTIRFYSSAELHGDERAPPDPLAGQTLLFVHYFGRRNALRIGQARAWQARGVHIVEDAAQALLSEGVGSSGDYVITSLRKFLPQPDGAMVGSRYPLQEDLSDPDEDFVSTRMIAKLLRGADAEAGTFLPLIMHSEGRLDGRIVPRRISRLSRELMTRSALDEVGRRRRDNWKLLRGQLTSLRGSVNSLFEDLGSGEVPLGMPVRVAAAVRDALRKQLAGQAVFCPVHWPLAHLDRSPEFASDRELSAQLLTLPIDQRMDERHVSRLSSLLEQCMMDLA